MKTAIIKMYMVQGFKVCSKYTLNIPSSALRKPIFKMDGAIASVQSGPGDAAPDVDFAAEFPKSQKSKAYRLFEVALRGRWYLPCSVCIRLEEGAKEGVFCPASGHKDLPVRSVLQSMMNGPRSMVGGSGKGECGDLLRSPDGSGKSGQSWR